MSKKKSLVICLATAMISLSSFTVSADSISTVQPIETTMAAFSSQAVNQSRFETLLPGEVIITAVSASWIEYSMYANRLSTGEVEVIVKEPSANNRMHYKHLATNARGDEFNPAADTAYYIETAGSYRIVLPKNSVSEDGYIYMEASFAPIGGDAIIATRSHKIPVDYGDHPFNPSSYIDFTNKNVAISASSFVADFNATATSNVNGDVNMSIDLHHSNAFSFYLENVVSSDDKTIAFPKFNETYIIAPVPTTSSHLINFTIPKVNVSKDGYIYLNLIYDIPIGAYKAGSIKIKVQ